MVTLFLIFRKYLEVVDKVKKIIVIILFIFYVVTVLGELDADWVTIRGNYERTAFINVKINDVIPLDKVSLGDVLNGETIIVKDSFLVIAKNHIYRFSPGKKEYVWRNGFSDKFLSMPTLYKGFLYVGGSDSKLYVVNVSTGKVVKRIDVLGPVVYSPIVKDDKILLSLSNKWLYLFSIKDNKTLWFFHAKDFLSEPCLVNNTVYLVSGNKVYALDFMNGNLLWSYRMGGKSIVSPIYSDNHIYVASLDGNVYAIKVSDGKLSWMFNTSNGLTIPLALDSQYIYVVSRDKIFQIEKGDGKLKGIVKGYGVIGSAPLIYENAICFIAGLKLFIIDSKTYKEIFSTDLPLCGQSFISGGKNFIVVSNKKSLFIMKIQEKKPLQPHLIPVGSKVIFIISVVIALIILALIIIIYRKQKYQKYSRYYQRY